MHGPTASGSPSCCARQPIHTYPRKHSVHSKYKAALAAQKSTPESQVHTKDDPPLEAANQRGVRGGMALRNSYTRKIKSHLTCCCHGPYACKASCCSCGFQTPRPWEPRAYERFSLNQSVLSLFSLFLTFTKNSQSCQLPNGGFYTPAYSSGFLQVPQRYLIPCCIRLCRTLVRLWVWQRHL